MDSFIYYTFINLYFWPRFCNNIVRSLAEWRKLTDQSEGQTEMSTEEVINHTTKYYSNSDILLCAWEQNVL